MIAAVIKIYCAGTQVSLNSARITLPKPRGAVRERLSLGDRQRYTSCSGTLSGFDR